MLAVSYERQNCTDLGCGDRRTNTCLLAESRRVRADADRACACAARGGYVIDFWGLGYDIAERMGLAEDIDRIGYHMREMRIVDDLGERVTGFGTKVFHELTGGRFVTLGRSDLSRLLFEKIKGTTEIIFGNEIVGLQEHTDCVQVQFKHAGERRFDLVIGADGLHSNVRRLVFGPAGSV